MDVSEPASISTGIAHRYATAVFELSKDEGALDQLSGDLDTLEAALNESADLRDLIRSPIYSREAQEKAIIAVAEKMELSATLRNVLGLMAQKRRLFVVPHMIRDLRDMLSKERGEVQADVISAKALTKTQAEKLSKTLAERVGAKIKINQTVDESLIGGLVIKVGSRMIDTSIKSKLAHLQNSMKEAR
ncbi:F0F1 ATP synthase subunit delta [Histidinibacterium aquaticum]|uniref:ATP synthase subunit delta n=1 Tax=Histidinibacterium aquaticum TaxID=2613962 RepID=A0A5J5GJN1_9RHOB|nr:F0F1 ATP synthase subunit delta [Histidinibacterium aquaticum]KAA9008270.1 F0F1 ATP synthase subunit delta [Histidinibacterium aquaticum]